MSRRTSPRPPPGAVPGRPRRQPATPAAAASGPRGLCRRADRGGRPARGRGRGDHPRGADAGGGRPAVGHRRGVPPGHLAHGLHLPDRRDIQGAGQPGGEVHQPFGHHRVDPGRTARRPQGPDGPDHLRRGLHLPEVAGEHRGAEADDPVAEHGALPRRPGDARSGGLPRHRGVLGRPGRGLRRRGPAAEQAGLHLPAVRRHLAGLPERPGAARRDRRTRRGRRAHAPALHQADQRRGQGQARGHGHHHAHVPRQLPLLLGGVGRV